MNRGIIILGMHRSGTSCLAGMLQSAGFYAGSVDEWTPDNTKGSRENTAVVKLNDSILSHGGGSWSKPVFSLSPTKEHYRIRDEITKQFLQSEQPWMFKDPRTLLTLPFWIEPLTSVALLGIFRHPLAVANSLFVRNSMPLHEGLLLWHSYNERLLNFIESNDTPLLYFSQNVASFTEATSGFLGAEFSMEIENGIIKPENMTNFISSSLIHQEQAAASHLEHSLKQAGISDEQAGDVVELWNRLVRLAVNPVDSDASGSTNDADLSDSISSLLQNEHFESALKLLKETLDSNENRTDLWQQAFNIIKRMGDSRLLLRWVKQSLKANPDHPGFLFEQAKLAWQTGEKSDALRMLEKVVSLTPGWKPAIKLLSNWYYEQQEWQKSADLLIKQNMSEQSDVDTLKFAQIFVDCGRGFNEKDSIREPVMTNGQKTDLIFDLSNFDEIKAIRFDPLNDYTVVRLNSMVQLDKAGREFFMTAKSSNAETLIDGVFGFSTKDPQVHLKISPSTHQNHSDLKISLQYIHVGTNALLHCLESIKPQVQSGNGSQSGNQEEPRTDSALTGKIAEILKGWELKSGESDWETHKNREVVLQGWAIPVKNEKINIIVQYDGLTRSYDCNVDRPDIVARFSKSRDSISINPTCGFHYKAPKNSKIKVGVEVDMRIYWIETVQA